MMQGSVEVVESYCVTGLSGMGVLVVQNTGGLKRCRDSKGCSPDQ